MLNGFKADFQSLIGVSIFMQCSMVQVESLEHCVIMWKIPSVLCHLRENIFSDSMVLLNIFYRVSGSTV